MDGDDRTAKERRNASQSGQSSSIPETEHTPSLALALAFLTVLVVLGFHEAEHVVELIQRFILYSIVSNGILGQLFHPEALHLVYNLLIFWLLAVVYTLGGGHRLHLWRRGMAAWWLLSFALVLQGYHLVEHLVKIWQFIDSGRVGTPGILGREVDLVWLHFFLATLTLALVAAAFRLGGFHRNLAAALRSAETTVEGGRSPSGARNSR